MVVEKIVVEVVEGQKSLLHSKKDLFVVVVVEDRRRVNRFG